MMASINDNTRLYNHHNSDRLPPAGERKQK